MRMYDLIAKKRDGHELSTEEIAFIIDEYVKDNISDYQMSAFLMAVFLKGMNDRELADLTMDMAKSGQMVDLSPIEGIKVDKHSTGGVGDKTTFILGPIVAACGGKVAKMSGRGLGHTGGTVDKMEAIPHMKSSLSEEEFFKVVNEVGVAVIGQSGELAPADKKIYALRDVTATVDCIPLIASSIMSKKLASGADAIVLDVKTGSGAFMKTLDMAIELAQKMVAIGTNNGRKMIAMITDMDRPLGRTIGNALEMQEVVETLKGHGPADLVHECTELSANMLFLSGKGTIEECRKMVAEVIANGKALEVFRKMVIAQGGDPTFIDDFSALPQAKYTMDIIAKEDGYIHHMNAERCGMASVVLGAGRERKDDPIDYGAGIVIGKKTGDAVAKGDVLATLYTNKEESLPQAAKMYEEALEIAADKPVVRPSIMARVTPDSVEVYGEEEHTHEIHFDGVLDDAVEDELLQLALEAREFAYAPYSHFAVGAAVLCADGSIYTGCNVENASYGMTNCAERTAVFKAVSEGHREFKAIAIVADTAEPCPPCGACRQIISEFHIPYVIMGNVKGEKITITEEEVLPFAFDF